MATSPPCIENLLGPKLSQRATITLTSPAAALRWSEYEAPKTSIIVNVFTALDVVETIKYCNQYSLKFLAQAGGHGWGITWSLGENDVVINLRGLNTVEVNKAEGTATIGGGTIVKEIVDELFANEMHVVSGGCNCVGTGFLFGGGLGRLMGEYGLGIDNLLSADLVTASGELITVTPTSPSEDLWWALRGAGHNFGVVTSYVVKAYPWINGGVHWSGSVVFTGDRVRDVTKAIDKLKFQKPMSIHYYFVVDPSSGQPVIIVNPYYAGKAEDARIAFKPIFDLNPVVDATRPTPWDELNVDGDAFCAKGGRKVAYTSGLKKLDPGAFENIWNAYVAFINEHGVDKVGQSAILVECYSYISARAVEYTSTSFPHRDVDFQAVVLSWHNDSALDRAAEEFGDYVRKQWIATSRQHREHAYINFARGDEPLDAIYGESWRIRKLTTIKSKWDPNGKFGQYFPIPTRH
ncbi:hypothetical protein DRE_01196 [Drechslerella stenobrocha 248]|uniref:FAD-binding PCMH-type domain-containing protein n=1 Tax=Drechslerella stenobrocha 248 TaxID=1043628 RepID=W7I6F5_9PEZI|nr:hypothetical protein DRE_01196 [Drechslerella stenobrocha 248]